MATIQQTNRPLPNWRSCPTTDDLIRETNRLTIEARGLPSGMQVYDFAPILREMKLPLRPLQDTERWAEGSADEQVFTHDGQLFCTFVRRSNGCSYLDFSEHARSLVIAHKAKKLSSQVEKVLLKNREQALIERQALGTNDSETLRDSWNGYGEPVRLQLMLSKAAQSSDGTETVKVLSRTRTISEYLSGSRGGDQPLRAVAPNLVQWLNDAVTAMKLYAHGSPIDTDGIERALGEIYMVTHLHKMTI